jgi:hypothetical protein
VSYRVVVWEAAQHDIANLPDRVLQLAAMRTTLELRENPSAGEPLRNRLRIGDLSRCRRLSFDRPNRQGKPRYRIVYFNDPDEGLIAVVQVVAVGLREQLAAYRAAAERLREDLRRRIEDA